MPADRTITFDDVTTQQKAPIPDGYQGFSWIGYDPYNQQYGGEVYAEKNGKIPTSGAYTVAGVGGLGFEMKLKGSGTFDLKSAVLAASNAGMNMDVTVVGRLNTVERYRRQFNAVSGYGHGPSQVPIDCNGVNEVVFYGSAIEPFYADNIVVSITTSYQGIVKSYDISLQTPNVGTNYKSVIHLKGDFGLAFLYFVPAESQLGTNAKRQGQNVFDVYLWEHSLPYFVDMLRNEGPVYFYFNDTTKTAIVRTTDEPVGEGE